MSPADPASTAVPLDDRSRVGEARRVAASAAAEAGLSEAARSDVGIVATELATNVLRHAGRGMLLVRRLDGAGGGVELLCLDSGSGMRDPADIVIFMNFCVCLQVLQDVTFVRRSLIADS